EMLDSVLNGEGIARSTASALSTVEGADLWDLFAAASRVRERFRGDLVDVCSIVNAKSGACTEDCSYCAQSVHHATDAPVYPLISVESVEAAALSARENGAKRFCIVTSGRGVEGRDDLETIARGIRRVKDAGLSSCATLGTLSRDQLAYLKDAGLDRYHHNIETSRKYFPRICSTHTFEDRIEVLVRAKSLGLDLCSGGILGMGEAMKDRIDMAFSLREIGADSVPINFLMPIAGTPLERIPPVEPLEALKSLALFRLILPEKEIRVCGGRGTALRSLHPLIFAAGADGFMIGNYLTQSGLDPREDLKMILDLGLRIS
ncbi:MAG TPA: biotin synthase BioB, partial [Nitrospirota bacterium]|nr:biotin synthase BioB [Nitrospirota bacterium]